MSTKRLLVIVLFLQLFILISIGSLYFMPHVSAQGSVERVEYEYATAYVVDNHVRLISFTNSNSRTEYQEYKTSNNLTGEGEWLTYLNYLGMNGWDLVLSTPAQDQSRADFFYFKRTLQS